MAGERLQRRVAAILSADVVGYSRLMGMDEAGTLSRLNALRREFIDPMIAAHSGRIVKLMGDGMLVEFASAVDAVTCAIEIQRQVREHGAGGSESNPIQLRIGINVGDIIIEGEDIFGDGVNIAARLEGIAETGGISISEDAWRQVQGKVAANFVDTGEQSLKNIPRPVRVYRLQLGDTTGAPSLSMSTSPSAPPPETPSLAVLPFQNMSGDSEQEHFCDGLVEDILTTLAKLSGLRVIARNSSFIFKGRAVDVREQLGVRYVLEGSVRRRRPCRKNLEFSGHVLSRGMRSFRVCSCRLDLKPRVIGFMPTPFAAVWNRPQRRCVSSPGPNSAKFNLAQNDGDVDQLYSNSSKVEKFIANGRSTGTHRF